MKKALIIILVASSCLFATRIKEGGGPTLVISLKEKSNLPSENPADKWKLFKERPITMTPGTRYKPLIAFGENTIAYASSPCTHIQLFNTQDLEKQEDLNTQELGIGNFIQIMEISGDDKRMAIISSTMKTNNENRITVIDLIKKSVCASVLLGQDLGMSIAFNPLNTNQLFFSQQPIWRPGSLKEIDLLQGQKAQPKEIIPQVNNSTLDISRDGTTLAFCTNDTDGPITKLFNLKNHATHWIKNESKDAYVTAVELSPKNTWVCCSQANGIQAYDAEYGIPYKLIVTQCANPKITSDPNNGRQVIALEDWFCGPGQYSRMELYTCDVIDGKKVQTIASQIWNFAINKTGNTIVALQRGGKKEPLILKLYKKEEIV